ncbi:hypothetical protein M4951_07235 [Blastopirellula sp. J2-11]|nr:hypothetical protein [Blastopirellula sp. J2-11]UUO08104.1 hypothetical protein M4951_07235 [Blastopirellula sp. J2-11]
MLIDRRQRLDAFDLMGDMPMEVVRIAGRDRRQHLLFAKELDQIVLARLVLATRAVFPVGTALEVFV